MLAIVFGGVVGAGCSAAGVGSASTASSASAGVLYTTKCDRKGM